MALIFTDRGLLTPAREHTATLSEIQQYLVLQTPFQEIRQRLFAQFQLFLDQLLPSLQQEGEIWINGSFVHQRARPSDLDFVVWIPYVSWEESESLRTQLTSTFEKPTSGLDFYFERLLPSEQMGQFSDLVEWKYWQHLFTRTKKHRRTKQSFPKGFIRLPYGRTDA